MAFDLGLLDTPATPTVHRPVLVVAVDGNADTLAGAVLAVDVALAVAPAVNRCTVTVAAAAPAVAPGAAVTVTIDAGDGAAVSTVSGVAAAANAGARGTVVLDIADASHVLAALRMARSYEQQSAGDILRDLCATAGVDTADVADGNQYPFVALDDRRPAWRHVAQLAAHAGLLVGVDGEGAVWQAAPAPDDVAVAAAYGRDALSLVTRTAQPRAVPGVVGQGAAGSHGADAWPWLVRDPAEVRVAGDGPVRFDGALRTPEAVQAAAQAAAARAHAGFVVVVPLAPAARPGSGVEVDAVPATFAPPTSGGAAGLLGAAGAALGDGGSTLAGAVTHVRHRWRAGAQATTTIAADLPATAAPAGGLL
jgi:hypothetical protein